MPNGHKDVYNTAWCQEKHQKLDKRMDSLESKFWGIIILLVTNLAGVTTLLLSGGVS
jgi:hypothetical protein